MKDIIIEVIYWSFVGFVVLYGVVYAIKEDIEGRKNAKRR